MQEYDTIKQALLVLHDKDNTPHYHLFMRFTYPVSLDNLCSWFNCSNERFQFSKRNQWLSMIKYAFHLNASDKYQYDFSCIVYQKNFNAQEFLENHNSDVNVFKLIESYAVGDISYEKLSSSISISDRLKKDTMIRKAQKLYQEHINYTNRDIKVYYIVGESGSGKTTLSKYICEINHLSYYISGSGDNFIDDYCGENVLILDDFRPSQMRFSDFLKLIDNNTGSPIKSRFYNKVPEFDYVFITNCSFPNNLYDFDNLCNEPKLQLLRRISKVVFVSKSTRKAIECCYDSCSDNYIVGDNVLFDMDIVFEYFSSKVKKVSDLF